MAEWQSDLEDKAVEAKDAESFKKYDNTSVDEALRRKLHSAYTFVRSTTENKKIFTLDHLIQERLDMISAGATREIMNAAGQSYASPRLRVSKLDLLDTLLKDTKAICDQLSRTKGGGQA